MSALHNEVRAVVRRFEAPRSTFLVAVHIAYQRPGGRGGTARRWFRDVAVVLHDLRRRGLVLSHPQEQWVPRKAGRRGPLWSVP